MDSVKPTKLAIEMLEAGKLYASKHKEALEHYGKFRGYFNELLAPDGHLKENLSLEHAILLIKQVRRYFEKYNQAAKERNQYLSDCVVWFEKGSGKKPFQRTDKNNGHHSRVVGNQPLQKKG